MASWLVEWVWSQLLMSSSQSVDHFTRRTFIRTTSLGLGALAGSCVIDGATARMRAPAQAAEVAPFSKRFAGTTIRVSMFDTAFPRGLRGLLPEFTELTGINVDFELLGFTVFLQRSDLELSGGTGAVDAMTLVFAQSGRWIGAGWPEDLTPFIKATNFDIEDLLPGPLAAMRRGEKIYGIPWLADSQLMLYRHTGLHSDLHRLLQRDDCRHADGHDGAERSDPLAAQRPARCRLTWWRGARAAGSTGGCP